MRKKDKKDESITLSKSTLWQGVSALLMILLVISIFTGGFSGNKGNNAGAVLNQPTKAAPNQPTNNPSAPTRAASLDANKLVDDDPVLGKKDAPLTIIEWSDYQCPFCRRFWTDTLPLLKKEYIDTGKVRFVYRDFPLSFHPAAQPSAEAANCAREQGGDEKYFEYHDKIFSEEQKLGSGTVQFGVAELKKWAKEIGLDSGKFDSCLDSGKYASEVQADFAAGQAVGIRGTPGFVVGNQPVSGAQPFSAFKAVIDAQLSNG